MKILEIILSLANFVTFLTLVIPRFRAIRWTYYAAPTALLVGALQMVVEGTPWQMIPAYILTIILFLIWLLGILIPGGIHVKRVVAFLGAGVGLLMLVISVALPIILPVFQFPKPTGPHAIGTLTYHWVDMSRPELFTEDPNDHRELMAQVWYPAENKPSSPRAPYIQDADSVTSSIGRLLNLPEFIFSHFKYVTTNAVASAPITYDKSSYPVLIYLTGINGFRSINTFQIEELVSHGYIVVGIDQPGNAPSVSFPDGQQIFGWSRNEILPLIMQSENAQTKAPTLYGKILPDGIIPYYAQDASFALNQMTGLNKSDPNHILTGRLDLGHAGVFGISLGGMNGAQASLKDPRFKACLIMDVNMTADVVKSGIQQPSMFITRDAETMRLEGWAEKDITQTLTNMRTVYESLPSDGYYVEIPKMFHVNFTDLPYWSPIVSQLGMTGPINGQRGFDIVNAYSLAFFDKELKGQSSSLLNGLSKQYPEVNFETRRPH